MLRHLSAATVDVSRRGPLCASTRTNAGAPRPSAAMHDVAKTRRIIIASGACRSFNLLQPFLEIHARAELDAPRRGAGCQPRRLTERRRSEVSDRQAEVRPICQVEG